MQQPIPAIGDQRSGDVMRSGALTLASINTQGIPLLGSQLPRRYRAIAQAFDASDVDVVSFQEVFTYYHLRLLVRAMPSFSHLSCRPSLAGPAGGLVTLSRRPIAQRRYRRFPPPPSTPGLPPPARMKARLKGVLLTRLAEPALWILNTHPAPNLDGDWSDANRFSPLHRSQLNALADTVRSADLPAVVCGDFNVSRDSGLHRAFMADTQLTDAFDGQCPPTFHSEYLDGGRHPHCIDFILVTASVAVERAETVFTDQETLPGGGQAHVSDHIGLRARVVLRS
jgi:sphingomyelin phosphodiesterase 2